MTRRARHSRDCKLSAVTSRDHKTYAYVVVETLGFNCACFRLLRSGGCNIGELHRLSTGYTALSGIGFAR
jgi:hypothetical protein